MKHATLKKVLSILICLSLIAGFFPLIQAQEATYEVNLNRGINLVPTDLVKNESFMSQYVRNDGQTLNLNHLFKRVGSSNVKNADGTLSTRTMQRNKTNFWWAKYQWTPNELEKQYLANSNYPLVYEGNVIPDYCDHWIGDDHWCKACVRFNNDDEWTFEVNDYGHDPNGKMVWGAQSSNSNSGSPQAVKKTVNSLVPEYGTLTYAAYSLWERNCGNPKVSGSTFYMVDTTVPYITDVTISGGSYQSLAGGDATGTVVLTFSEDIRFANNKVPSGLKLNLDAYYGSQAGGNRNENTSYVLSADFTSLVKNQMVFTFKVPKSVNHIYITGISNNQPMLNECDLYVYTGSGERLTNTRLKSPTMITDLSGNYLRWSYSDKTCSTVTYDGVAPTLEKMYMSGADIDARSTEPPTSWEENSGNNRFVYAGVGDRITFTAVYSENINISGNAKAVLSITNANGEPVKLGIRSHRGNTVVFQDLRIEEWMMEAGEQIVIDSVENMTVTDYAGNTLSGNAVRTPDQEIALDADKPVISTKLTADGDGVYAPYADTEGEYFTFPLKVTETKIANAPYSGVSGMPMYFTLEMLDGDAYGYKWYIDNTQQVDKNATMTSATTGTTKNAVEDIADDKDYYLHIWLDKNTDYNYTAEGGMDENGVYFNGRLTVYAEDWAGNRADTAAFVLKHQVDTEGPGGNMLSSLNIIPHYVDGKVTFEGSFRVKDNYSIEKLTYQWFYKLGDAAEFAASEAVTITDVGSGLNTVLDETVEDTYDYINGPVRGQVYLRVTVEDRLGRSYTFESNRPQFNFEKATSNSSVEVNTAATPVTLPVVTMAAPKVPEGMTAANDPRTILVFADTRNEDFYWIYDPWDYDKTNYGTDPFATLIGFLDEGFRYQYEDVWLYVPGRFYYVEGTLDLEQNSGDFTVHEFLRGTNVTGQGTAQDLYGYLKSYYGPMELHLVTTSSLEEFVSPVLDFNSTESIVDSYTVYIANTMDYEVQDITVENEAVLNYTSGAPAVNLDNATVSFRIVNTTDTEAVRYGLDFVDYDNTNVKLYYLGKETYWGISDSTPLIQTWDLEQSADGSYTLTIEPGKCVENGWYEMELTLTNRYTGETSTVRLGRFFMDATALDITMDAYYKEYDHEDMYLGGHGMANAWNETGLEARYAEGGEIVLGLDTAPEGWTMETHLTFQAGGRSEDSDPLYWESFDVAPRIRVYNHTYNAVAGIEDADSGLWLTSDGRYGTTFSYVPYLAAADADTPYGAADALKLPFLEGYNLLVYEIESINGLVTTKEITVNVFGQADDWELDTVIYSANGVDINSLTASAVYASSAEKLRFSYLNSRQTYYTNSYKFTSDLDTTVFYLIDDQGNLSVKEFALLDENGNLVDVDGNEPSVFVYDQSEGAYATFVVTIDAHDDDSLIDPRDLTLTFDAAYSAALLGLPVDEMESNSYELTIPVPLAVDENGELLRNEDGTYPVWESYDTNNYGIYRTQILRTEPTQEERENYGYEDCVEIKVWGAWKPDYAATVTMTASAEDSYGNTASDGQDFYASAWLDINHWALAGPEDENYCCSLENHVNIDKQVTDDGELAITLHQPVAAIDGYGIRLPMTEGYTFGQHEKVFVTSAPMIVNDGEFAVTVTDLFGTVHNINLYVNAFGELGIDVSYSTTEPTNQSVTVTAQATGEYDKITSITSDKGDVGQIDSVDPTAASITVEDNCAITIETEDGMSRVVQVGNIDKVLDAARIVYYDESYNILDTAAGAESVTAQLVCDTEVVYATNGPDSYEFPAGSKKGDTYTFEYRDRAGNTGTITAVLPCDLAEPPEGDTAAPDILVNLFARVGGRYSNVAEVANPDDGSELNGELAAGKAQGFRLTFTISDASDTKVQVLPAGTAAPTDYASAAQGSSVEGVTLTAGGRSATIEVSANTTFDVHIIDAYGNVKSVPGIAITTIDNTAPVLTPIYEIGRDENGYAVVTATFYPSEEEKFEVITPLSDDVLGREVQIGTETVDGEEIPIMATRYYHIFTENGSYSFTYQDDMGNIGTATAQIRGLSTEAAVVSRINWYGTEAPAGQSNVTPDKSGMVNRDIVARLHMNMALSDVRLFAYDAAAENNVGAPLDPALPVRVSFTGTAVDLTYTGNVEQQIVVEYTASASGRKGYYVLDAVGCIDKEAPTVTVTRAELADDHRSMVIVFTTNEETVMNRAMIPVYATTHMWIATDDNRTELCFTDRAGNQTRYTVTENADVDTLELTAEFSLQADGSNATADPLNDLKADVGSTMYVRVNKKATAVLTGTAIGTVEADTWTQLVLPDSGGLHILSLTDVSTGELLQILVAAQPKDNVAPVITLEGSTVLVTEDASVDELLAAVRSGVTVTDNVDAAPGFTVTGYPEMVEVGLYELTYTAADAAGNVSTISRVLYIMAEGTPMLKVNGEVGVPYGKIFLKNGGESTDITLELLNMEDMTEQPLVIKYRKGELTTGQMKYSATTVENMSFTVTGTGHYTIYVRSQDRVEFVTYIYVEG